MEINLRSVFENALYLLALLNPASKIMFLASYPASSGRGKNFELSWKSSAAALVILILLAAAGQFLLGRIFRVELYSLQITGGLVVFVIGWTAINQGRFVKQQQDSLMEGLTDISLVPLATPLIAGPGMIAAVIAGSVADGLLPTCAALTLALLINFLLMISAGGINKFLVKTHLLGPLIRVTGLIIAVVAMQMMITGIRTAFKL
ncbi:MAG: MarC family protein [Lentisphaeria bacterium]|nr:MarC family protein [Lentisphaeria bacterium]